MHVPTGRILSWWKCAKQLPEPIIYFQVAKWPRLNNTAAPLFNFVEVYTLDQMHGRFIGDKQVTIRQIGFLSQISDCQVLFVCASESHRCDQILREAAGAPVLTIGEDEDFTRMGGIIRFYNEKNHIRFEINQTAALKSDLKLSAKLLEVAAAIQ